MPKRSGIIGAAWKTAAYTDDRDRVCEENAVRLIVSQLRCK
jgi:hypothetical protein